MPDLTLGTTPSRLTVWLVDAAPFHASVTADSPFPEPPELVFDTGTVWPATLDTEATTAAWLHPAADVEAVAELGPRRVTLRDPASHHVWAHGTVYVARVVDNGDASTVAPGGSITVDTLDGNVSITYAAGTHAHTEYVETTDPRLTDARTPTAHDHPVTDLTATGTPSATTYLRGDGAWATPEGGGGAAVSFTATRAASGGTIPATTFAIVPLDTVTENTGGGTFTEGIYTVPEPGVYLCTGNLRFTDSGYSGAIGLGIHTSTADGPYFYWTYISGAQRRAAQYTRQARFNTGDQLRFFAYLAEGTAGGTVNTQGTSMSLTKISE